MSKLLATLKKLEWSECREGHEGEYAREDPIQVPACPVCHRVKPGSRYAYIFKSKDRGHRKSCCLKIAIRKIKRESRK